MIDPFEFETHEILNNSRCAAMSHSAILGIMDIQNLHFKMGEIKRKKEPDIHWFHVHLVTSKAQEQKI